MSAIERFNIEEAFELVGSKIMTLHQEYKDRSMQAKRMRDGIEDKIHGGRNKNVKLSRSRFECCLSSGRDKYLDDPEQ